MSNLERTLTSNEVAEMVGRRHDQVLRDIDHIIGQLRHHTNVESYFIKSTYRNLQNKEQPNYLLTKKGCELYSTRMTGYKGTQFAVEYIERFNRMEQAIKKEQNKLPENPMEVLELFFSAQKNTDEKVEKIEKKVTDLEENQVLGSGDYGYISRRIHQRVAEIARGFGKISNEQRGELYKDINSGIKRIAGVGSRTQLRTKHYEAVVEFIQDWEPSTATKSIVRQMSLDLAE